MQYTVIHGDCMDELRKLPEECADAVVTDPPYGIAYTNKRGQKIRNDERPFIWWLHDAFRILKPAGALLCFCRWDVQEAFRWGIELAGFRIKSQVVWDRRVHGMGDTKAAFAPRHDVIWFAVKGRFAFPGKRPSSVLSVQRILRDNLHPTQKPVELMRCLVEAVVHPGGLVVDPFAGSGSTGVACALAGCNFLGIEADGAHFSTAEQRVRKAFSSSSISS
jgi:DNA modification methylase